MEDRTQEKLALAGVEDCTAWPTPTKNPGLPTLTPGKVFGISMLHASLPDHYASPRAGFLDMAEQGGHLKIAREGIAAMMFVSHGSSYFAGWWHDPVTGKSVGSVGEKIALIHSELSEMLEADRKGLMDDKLPERPGIEVEMADTLHRLFDLAGALNVDLAGAYVDKFFFNGGREDHDPENRAKEGGKAY